MGSFSEPGFHSASYVDAVVAFVDCSSSWEFDLALHVGSVVGHAGIYVGYSSASDSHFASIAALVGALGPHVHGAAHLYSGC